jgi:DNA-binding MarR family transcriptional regulator
MSLPRTWSQPGAYYIPLRLSLLTRMIEREMNRQMHSPFELSVAEWRVLATTCSSGPASAADVAASFEADKGQVSRAVANLMKKGFIMREPGATGRKKMTLTPTPEGREAFELLHARRQEYYRAIMRDLPPDALKAFDEMLTLIASRVDEHRRNTEK